MRFLVCALLLATAGAGKSQKLAEKDLLALDAKWYSGWLQSDAATMNQIEADDMVVMTTGLPPSLTAPIHKSRNMEKRSSAIKARMAATTEP